MANQMKQHNYDNYGLSELNNVSIETIEKLIEMLFDYVDIEQTDYAVPCKSREDCPMGDDYDCWRCILHYLYQEKNFSIDDSKSLDATLKAFEDYYHYCYNACDDIEPVLNLFKEFIKVNNRLTDEEQS